MTKEEIFRYFYTNSANLGIRSILAIMFAALLICGIIYFTYYILNKGVSYNRNFNVCLCIINLISVVIMLMISSNIVISLGMVGALSIVRFRTAIKDSKDTVFIFWAITEGLCIGSQNFKLAIATTLFIAIIISIFQLLPKLTNKYLLIISGSNSLNQKEIFNTLEKYTLFSKIRNVSIDNDSEELIIEIKTKGELDADIVNKLLKLKDINSVNYVIESGENVG